MKKIILIGFLVISVLTATAQPIPPESIEDSVIGWKRIYHFKGTKEPMTVDDKIYSATQLSICDTLANWMQASYMPKGGLGEIRKFVSPKLGLYDQHKAGKPQSYGAYAKTYVELRYNSSHKIEPVTNSNVLWNVAANQVPGDWSVRDICTPILYYFTMPTADTEEGDEFIRNLLDLTKTPSTQRYITFWVKNMGFGRGWENVLLCKDNKSPFLKITKGEYLQALEAAIPRYYEKEKKRLTEAHQGLTGLDEKIGHFKVGLKKNNEKYKDRLNELALTKAQPELMDLLDGRDIFSNGYLTDTESTSGRYPVYKVDPVMAALCKTDKPQWILISWEYYPGSRAEKQQHEAIINNFNFDYVYNFFFDPEKVKGPYKPLRSPMLKETVVVMEASAAYKKNVADKNIHFFDDFSTSAVDKTPISWRVDISLKGAGVVTRLDGTEGNWVTVAGDDIKPTTLKKPLPQNFTLSYDLIAAQNFTWGAHGLTLRLAKESTPGSIESYLNLKLRPGYDGRDGEVMLETKFPKPPGYSNGTKWVEAPGFSNNKKINRVAVTVKKIDEKLEVFIDKTKIIELDKAIPAAQLFNFMSFDGGAREGGKFYISNIKITKD